MTVYILVSEAATRIYVRKKILALLMLQPVPSLLRTSLRHCRYVAFHLIKALGQYKRHPVTKFEHGSHGASKRKFNHMTV